MTDTMRELCAHELENVGGGSVASLPAYVFQTGAFASIVQGAANNAAGAAALDAPGPCPAGMICT